VHGTFYYIQVHGTFYFLFEGAEESSAGEEGNGLLES
jgi:hypothetical protein